MRYPGVLSHQNTQSSLSRNHDADGILLQDDDLTVEESSMEHCNQASGMDSSHSTSHDHTREYIEKHENHHQPYDFDEDVRFL